jgi:hypothetical protein
MPNQEIPSGGRAARPLPVDRSPANLIYHQCFSPHQQHNPKPATIRRRLVSDLVLSPGRRLALNNVYDKPVDRVLTSWRVPANESTRFA